MMRILLADDEPVTVDSMEFMLKKAYGDSLVIDKASSGKEAIEHCMASRPDIAVMDINMPGIDGMQAIRRIREIHSGIHFLIVTAMEYFDYLVEAVRTEEIDEYLLKPLRKEQFLESIQNIIQKIEQEKQNREKLLHMEEQLQMAMPVLEKNFIGTICLAEPEEHYIQEFCTLFSISRKQGYIMIIEFYKGKNPQGEKSLDVGLREMEYYREYYNYLKQMCSCIIGDIVRSSMVVLVYQDVRKKAYDDKKKSIDLALRILEQIEKSGDDARISIGGIYPVEQAKRSYDEACQAMRRYKDFTDDSKIYHIQDIAQSRRDNSNEDRAKRMLTLIREGNTDRVRREIYAVFSPSRQKEELDGAKNDALYLLTQVHEEYRKTEESYIETLEKIIQGSSVWEVQQDCEDYVLKVIEQSVEDKEEKIRNIIGQANQYMKDHLSEKITLEDLSRSVYLSEYYFSRLYKAATGENYSSQLLRLRMEKAKKLLGDRHCSVREIARQVGYPDPNYFSKVFKRYTGMTVSEYKNRAGSGEESIKRRR